MVLNTLAIDPRRAWKGPWRVFHEEMLDCCHPLERVQREGITLQQVTGEERGPPWSLWRGAAPLIGRALPTRPPRGTHAPFKRAVVPAGRAFRSFLG